MLHREAVEAATLALLKNLMALPVLDDFYLVGGTALALRIGHRISVDLDLFSPHPFDQQRMAGAFTQLIHHQLVGESTNTLNLEVDGIKVDLIAYQYPLVGDVTKEDTIRLASLQDIACMKLSAISSRGARRDFYDLYFLLDTFTMPEILEFYKVKYTTRDIFHVAKSLLFFDDAEQEPEPRLLRPVSWDVVKERMSKEVRRL